jgi:peptidoglycan/LPS O-acetylase OafA/YrhL
VTNLTKENNNFNLVRLFACFQVLILHSRSFYNLDENTIFSKILWLFPGVIIFFCISGFLIAKSFEFSTPKGFIKKRILRIYPALIVNIIITSIILYYFGLIKFNFDFIKYLIAQLSVFQFYVPENLKHFGIGHPNGALWTISVELQFYILFFIIAILTNWKTKSLAIKNSIILFLIASSCLINYVANNYLIYESLTYKLLFNSIPYHFTFFGIGILLWVNFKAISNLFINKLGYWFLAILLSIILIIINDVKNQKISI